MLFKLLLLLFQNRKKNIQIYIINIILYSYFFKVADSTKSVKMGGEEKEKWLFSGTPRGPLYSIILNTVPNYIVHGL